MKFESASEPVATMTATTASIDRSETGGAVDDIEGLFVR